MQHDLQLFASHNLSHFLIFFVFVLASLVLTQCDSHYMFCFNIYFLFHLLIFFFTFFISFFFKFVETAHALRLFTFFYTHTTLSFAGLLAKEKLVKCNTLFFVLLSFLLKNLFFSDSINTHTQIIFTHILKLFIILFHIFLICFI